MNILFIDGSPRERSLISRMISIMQQEAEKLNAQTEIVKVSHLSIAPCRGCMACRKSKQCSLSQDDAQQVLEKIKRADALVVGSPCYWGNMNGYLKVLFDRMVYGMMDENSYGIPIPLHKGKKAIIVSTCTTMWPFNILFYQSKGVIRAIKEILKYSGFTIKATFQKENTRKKKNLSAKEEERLRRKIRKLV